MAKRPCKRPEWLHVPHIAEIYSVSNSGCKDFADYIQYWRHNGYWFFDSPQVIKTVAEENAIDIAGTMLFYYEAHELEFDGENWNVYAPEPSFPTDVIMPAEKKLEGFDVVNFTAGTSPECSGLCCSSLAEELPTNRHCLFTTFEEAESYLAKGAFNDSEPGPYRIFAVYSTHWP
jgi:hypothetical protein